MHIRDRQALFEVGDEIWFSARGKGRLRGLIEQLNPTRAVARCGDDCWTVPYGGLHHVCGSTAKQREQRLARLAAVAAEARELMDRNGLAAWSFGFVDARKRLGTCRYGDKSILLSRGHAFAATPDQVTDTILHEIAHALAGPNAGHGPAWKAVARRLGATPKSCAPESAQARGAREAARAKFRTGDAVSFSIRGEIHSGVIERMNPKRARVRGRAAVWLVPYARLEPVESVRSRIC